VPADYAARVRAVHESGGYGSTGCAARAPPAPAPQPRDRPPSRPHRPGAGQPAPAPPDAASGRERRGGGRGGRAHRRPAAARRYGSPWRAAEAEKNLLRTHTTAVSTRMLHGLAAAGFAPARLFSIDRVFRNEAIDRTHLAEFNQIEGARPPRAALRRSRPRRARMSGGGSGAVRAASAGRACWAPRV